MTESEEKSAPEEKPSAAEVPAAKAQPAESGAEAEAQKGSDPQVKAAEASDESADPDETEVELADWKNPAFEKWMQAQFERLRWEQIEAVLQMSSEGSTIPFMARYRKERTRNLDEVQIAAILTAWEDYSYLFKRQSFVLGKIEEQGALSDELKRKVLACFDREALEDLYLPYKKERQTKAHAAREAGLEEFANWLWDVGHGEVKAGSDLQTKARTYVKADTDYDDFEKVIAGAQSIVVERLSLNAELRERVRRKVYTSGFLRSSKAAKAKEKNKFENYFDYNESIESLLESKNSHRYLALRRGKHEKQLKVQLCAEGGRSLAESLISFFEREANPKGQNVAAKALGECAKIAVEDYVLPSIEKEVHKRLKEVADEAAIRVFGENLKNILMESPFGAKAVLGVDPGIRTGSKLALVDAAGKLEFHGLLRFESESEQADAKKLLVNLLKAAQVKAVAVGNGTNGRQAESFIRKVLKEGGVENVPVVMVNEAGASVYSASEVAREEFPELDITVRGAVSIARRLQDPLAELVKIDAKSIGVGQYQHDVHARQLKRSLDQIVDSCVNGVGVNLNTASEYLLSRVSGIGPKTAKAIVEFRKEKGALKNRKSLLEVPGLGEKVFDLAAGFLRVPESENALDNTGVHPESYEVLENFLQAKGWSVQDVIGPAATQKLKNEKELKDKLGSFTFKDIVDELEKPGRDPRQSFVDFSFRDDIHDLKDLKKGMVCPGVVSNVTNFGAFVDIGVHHDGLVHISQITAKFIDDPRKVVKPGDRVKVKVLDVDLQKRQLSLSMKLGEAPAKSVARSEANGSPNERRPRQARQNNAARSHSGSSEPSRTPQQRGEQRGERGERGPKPTRPGERAGASHSSSQNLSQRSTQQPPSQRGGPSRRGGAAPSRGDRPQSRGGNSPRPSTHQSGGGGLRNPAFAELAKLRGQLGSSSDKK